MRKILVLGTGGTISCTKSKNGLTPAVPAAELIKGMSTELSVELKTEQLFELDSTNMTPRHWEALARRIRGSYDKFDGFVITHGTDTMGYAASSLACLIQNSRKPIVFTGSMKPMPAEGSDARGNLCDAVTYAADERAFGVRVAFSGYIYDGRSVSKTDSNSLEAFDSLNGNDSCISLNNWRSQDVKRSFSGETRFYDRLSDNVFLAKLIPGQELLVPESARAVILEGYGDGGVPDYHMGAVERLVSKGVYVIIATQCLYGGTKLGMYEVGRVAAERFSLLETGKMTIEYAAARARWALEYSNGFEEFRKLFYDGNFIRSFPQ